MQETNAKLTVSLSSGQKSIDKESEIHMHIKISGITFPKNGKLKAALLILFITSSISVYYTFITRSLIQFEIPIAIFSILSIILLSGYQTITTSFKTKFYLGDIIILLIISAIFALVPFSVISATVDNINLVPPTRVIFSLNFYQLGLIISKALIPLILGGGLFFIRLKIRCVYGLTEIIVGIILALDRLSVVQTIDKGLILGMLTASVYLVVRGMDNIHQGWTKSPIDPVALWLTNYKTLAPKQLKHDLK